MENARIALADKLIGLGYNGISDAVPADVMHRAKVTSGYFAATYQLQAAKRLLTKCALVAPFSGRITDLVNKRHQRVDKLCCLVNDTRLDVEFEVLEAEIKQVHVGQTVWVNLFADDTERYKGQVVNVNPAVSDKGLIKVMARIPNAQGKLMDGMNVKVIVETMCRIRWWCPRMPSSNVMATMWSSSMTRARRYGPMWMYCIPISILMP